MAFHLPLGQKDDHLLSCGAVSIQKDIPLAMEKVNILGRYIFSYLHDSCLEKGAKHLQERFSIGRNSQQTIQLSLNWIHTEIANN